MTEKNEQALAGIASELNAELGLLKDIINRVADELNLPTESGNRVHDLQFWLDSPKIEVDNETLKKAAANMVVGIPESDEEFRFKKAEIISEVIDAVANFKVKAEQQSDALSKAMVDAIESRDVSKPMKFTKA